MAEVNAGRRDVLGDDERNAPPRVSACRQARAAIRQGDKRELGNGLGNKTRRGIFS